MAQEAYLDFDFFFCFFGGDLSLSRLPLFPVWDVSYVFSTSFPSSSLFGLIRLSPPVTHQYGKTPLDLCKTEALRTALVSQRVFLSIPLSLFPSFHVSFSYTPAALCP